MLKLLSFLALSSSALAAGPAPAVNSDMSCTLTGQVVMYNGSALVCSAPTRPTKTVSTLPTCNSGAAGAMYIVTDALTPVGLAAPTGGGAVVVGVTCNGSAYIVQ